MILKIQSLAKNVSLFPSFSPQLILVFQSNAVTLLIILSLISTFSSVMLMSKIIVFRLIVILDNTIVTQMSTWELYTINIDQLILQFFNEQYPCGDKGHEFVVTHKKDNEMKEGWGKVSECDINYSSHIFIKEHWVKDNYIDCRDSSLYFTDTQGNQRKLELDDHIQCKLRLSFPLFFLLSYSLFKLNRVNHWWAIPIWYMDVKDDTIVIISHRLPFPLIILLNSMGIATEVTSSKLIPLTGKWISL